MISGRQEIDGEKVKRTAGGVEVYQRISPLQFFVGESVPMLIQKLKGTADERLACALVRLRDTLALHALLLKLKVPYQATAGDKEKNTSLQRKGLRFTHKELAPYTCYALSRSEKLGTVMRRV